MPEPLAVFLVIPLWLDSEIASEVLTLVELGAKCASIRSMSCAVAGIAGVVLPVKSAGMAEPLLLGCPHVRCFTCFELFTRNQFE